nr:hypothetical protein CFP56_43821 [Quercus suber]
MYNYTQASWQAYGVGLMAAIKKAHHILGTTQVTHGSSRMSARDIQGTSCRLVQDDQEDESVSIDDQMARMNARDRSMRSREPRRCQSWRGDRQSLRRIEHRSLLRYHLGFNQQFHSILPDARYRRVEVTTTVIRSGQSKLQGPCFMLPVTIPWTILGSQPK